MLREYFTWIRSLLILTQAAYFPGSEPGPWVKRGDEGRPAQSHSSPLWTYLGITSLATPH